MAASRQRKKYCAFILGPHFPLFSIAVAKGKLFIDKMEYYLEPQAYYGKYRGAADISFKQMSSRRGQSPCFSYHVDDIYHIGQRRGPEKRDKHVAKHRQGDLKGLRHDNVPHGLKTAHADRLSGFHLADGNGQDGGADGF